MQPDGQTYLADTLDGVKDTTMDRVRYEHAEKLALAAERAAAAEAFADRIAALTASIEQAEGRG